MPLFGILFFIVEDLFIFVFGEKWGIAGMYAQVILPLFFIRFISSTLSKVLIVFEKQKNELIINFVLLLTGILLISYFDDFTTFLYFFTIFMSLNYLAFLLYYYRLSKGIV